MEQVNYGKTYKILRKKRGVTLEQAASGIIDVSTLSRWENGKGNMYFDNVVELIKKLNLYYDEFIAIARGKEVETDWNINAIFVAYNNEDLEKLKFIAQKWQVDYQETFQEKSLFYLAAACSNYSVLTNQDIMPKNAKLKLNYIIKNIKHWGQYQTQHVGNCVEMVETQLLFNGIMAIKQELKTVSEVDMFRYRQDLFTIFEMYYVLIKRTPKMALKAKNEIISINIPSEFMDLKITGEFLHELLNYTQKQPSSVQNMDEIIDFLNKYDYQELAHDLGVKFKSLLTLYFANQDQSVDSSGEQ